MPSVDETLARARREVDKMLTEARRQAEQIIGDGQARAESLERDAQERHRQAMGSLVQTREELERRVDDLRAFEREYRSRQKAYLEGPLRDLEVGVGPNTQPSMPPALQGAHGQSETGLPRRVPGANLLPGSGGSGPVDGGPVVVSIVDDHPDLCYGILARLPRANSSFAAGVMAATVAEFLALDAAAARRSDVVLLDLTLEDGSSPADNVARLKDHEYPVVIYTGEEQPERLQDTLGIGADALVRKEEAEHLEEALTAVVNGDHGWVSPLMAAVVLVAPGPWLSPARWRSCGYTPPAYPRNTSRRCRDVPWRRSRAT